MTYNMTQRSFAGGYLFLAGVLNTAKIEKLVVPEVVQSGSTDVVLDCQFSVSGAHFTLQWWFSSDSSMNNSTLVYEWSPPSPPRIAGVLEGLLDVSYKVSLDNGAICLRRVEPALGGKYTCVIINEGQQTRAVKNMVVFSPEEELNLTIKINVNSKLLDIICNAYGVYPQPDLILEYDNEPIAQQVQRLWRSDRLAKYDAESKAQLAYPTTRGCGKPVEVTCRLYLPQADYIAFKKKFFSLGDQCNLGQKIIPVKLLTVLLITLII